MEISKLLEYATDRQKEILLAIESEGSDNKAALKLGLSKKRIQNVRSDVNKKAALMGYSPKHNLIHAVPDGFKLKGASTMYDMATGEAKIQWVKSTIDGERQQEIFKEALQGMTDALPKEIPIKQPTNTDANLAACYPVGDHHFGMLAWHDEVGQDYDVAIAETLLNGAINHLVDASPSCDNALIVLLGDFMHYDSFEAVTPAHKNLLDADGRFPKMVRAAIKTIRYMIAKCLSKHQSVHVIVEIGNHDPSSSIFLTECLHNIYENEPRITIDRSPSHYHYWRFGKCLIGTHHGDKAKHEKLPMIMAVDRASDWGDTDFRYWWTGHIHNDTVKDFAGVRCESFRVLCPADAYASNAGYRTGRDMKSIILHKEYGEVARNIVNPKMLESLKIA